MPGTSHADVRSWSAIASLRLGRSASIALGHGVGRVEHDQAAAIQAFRPVPRRDERLRHPGPPQPERFAASLNSATGRCVLMDTTVRKRRWPSAFSTPASAGRASGTRPSARRAGRSAQARAAPSAGYARGCTHRRPCVGRGLPVRLRAVCRASKVGSCSSAAISRSWLAQAPGHDERRAGIAPRIKVRRLRDRDRAGGPLSGLPARRRPMPLSHSPVFAASSEMSA